MTVGSVIDAINQSSELGNEVITDPHQIAELGSVKPKEYGTLMKRKLSGLRQANHMESLFAEKLFCDSDISAFETEDLIREKVSEKVSPEYSSRELAQETADSLADAGITAKCWESASLPEREKLLESAASIIEKQMQLTPEQTGLSPLYGSKRIDGSAVRYSGLSAEQTSIESGYVANVTEVFYRLSRIRYALQRDSSVESVSLNEGRAASHDAQAYLDTAYFKKTLSSTGSK